ncbi:iron-sulfur cluster co-chaperone protein HscB-like [Asterias amurensis]|uniref:iron-sulfur cluster co-chaperone protein HscB-like n=1 Tax=Asterias amurensis TaxID=7602 RepID=UPI003AB47378
MSKLIQCLYRNRSLDQSRLYSGSLLNTSSYRWSTPFENRGQNFADICQRSMSAFTSKCNRILMQSRLSVSTSSMLTNYTTMYSVNTATIYNSAHNQSCIFPLQIRQRQTPLFSSFVGRLSYTRRSFCNSSSSSVTGTCWNCNAQITVVDDISMVQFFCGMCNAIQPVYQEANYFQVLNCEVTFDLNPAQLTQTFRNLQRQLHPDKFSIKPKVEQEFSAEQSSQVNKAYSTLLKPLSRGLYLLELNGLTIEEGDSGIEPEFLMEVMETNEELADSKDEETVRRIGKENDVMLESLLKDLSEAFSKKEYSTAREILMRLKYFANIDDKVKEHLEKHS